MGNRVVVVDHRHESLLDEMGHLAMGIALVTVVEDDFDMNAAQFRLDERLRDGPRREPVGEQQHLAPSQPDFADDDLRASAVRREVDIRRERRTDARPGEPNEPGESQTAGGSVHPLRRSKYVNIKGPVGAKHSPKCEKIGAAVFLASHIFICCHIR